MKYVFAIIFCFVSAAVVAQSSLVYQSAQQHYQRGVELFIEKNFAAARQQFEKIQTHPVYDDQLKNRNSTTPVISDNNDGLLLRHNMEYYVAVCASECNDPDAEKKLTDYYLRFHETDKRRLIAFHLGRFHYRNNNYGTALDYFEKVNTSDLDNEQLVEFKFQKAYCQFVKKQFDEAQPVFRQLKEVAGKYQTPSAYYFAYIAFQRKDYDNAQKAFEKISDSKMYASVVPYYLAQLYYLKGNESKVLETVDKHLSRSDVKYKTEMNYLRGKVLFKQGKFKEALQPLAGYINAQSRVNSSDLYMLAMCHYKTENCAEAIPLFVQVNLANDSLKQFATYALADCYLKTKQLEKARAAFQVAAELKDDVFITENALFHFGKLSHELGYTSDAVKNLELYLRQYASGTYRTEAAELLTTALLKTRDFEKAYKVIENLDARKSPALTDAYQKVTYFRAVQLFNDKRLKDAAELCDKSLTNPVSKDLHALATYLKAEILFEQGLYDDALTQYNRFNQLITPAVEQKNSVSKFRALYNSGYCCFKQKNYREAQRYFSAAIDEADLTVDVAARKSLLPDLHLRFADCAFVNKEYNKAVSSYSKIADNKWPQSDYALYQKGIILGLQSRNNEKIATLNQLLASYPKTRYEDKAVFELGETWLELSEPSKALQHFQRVVNEFSASPLAPAALMKSGLTQYNMNSKTAAAETFKQVVKKYGGTADAREAMNILKDLYVELGKPDEYFEFAEKNGGIVAGSEKDSLSFAAAQRAMNENGCTGGLTPVEYYLAKYPRGIFAAEAHWMRAECLTKNKQYTSVLTDYEFLIAAKDARYYERALLNASGICYYETKQTDKAFEWYVLLIDAASTPQNTYTALMGATRSAFRLKKWSENIRYASQMLDAGIAKPADLNDLYYMKAKSHLAVGEREQAAADFGKMNTATADERTAEAKFYQAELLHDKGEYAKSLSACMELKEKYSSYEYWYVKTFILLAKNYYRQDNAFQAKATLESILENYKGDAALLDEARSTLDAMNREELNKSKLIQELQRSPELEMDTINNRN